jgi:hypothetical protein
MQEQEYICWHNGQREEMGRSLKAPSPKAAAQKAIDIWEHELEQEFDRSLITVWVKDSDQNLHEIKNLQ